MQPTTHYHTTSNLDRLRVRVELRKARDGIFQFLSNHRKKDEEEEEGEKNKTTEEFRRTFEWQEKVYSPKEIIKYTNMSKVKRVNVVHQAWTDQSKRRVQGKVDEEDLESVDGGDRGKVDLRMTTEVRICSILTHIHHT